MANDVYNIINLGNCTEETRARILESVRMEDRDPGSIDFEKVLPMPDSVYRGPLGKEELARYPGERNWYYWAREHWGTKWNAYGFEEIPEGKGDIRFCTAWSAAHPVVKELSAQYPDVRFELTWADEDIGSNTGRTVFQNGGITDRFYPPDQSEEAIRFAAEVWDLDPQDFGLDLKKETGPGRTEPAQGKEVR